MVISYLKGDVSKLGSGLGHSRLLLSAVDCVWSAVVGNAMVEDIFLESEGALILLDLLKVCNSAETFVLVLQKKSNSILVVTV